MVISLMISHNSIPSLHATFPKHEVYVTLRVFIVLISETQMELYEKLDFLYLLILGVNGDFFSQ